MAILPGHEVLGRAKDFGLEIHSVLDHYKLSAYACVALLVMLFVFMCCLVLFMEEEKIRDNSVKHV